MKSPRSSEKQDTTCVAGGETQGTENFAIPIKFGYEHYDSHSRQSNFGYGGRERTFKILDSRTFAGQLLLCFFLFKHAVETLFADSFFQLFAVEFV